jgi:acetyl esterase/lipase
MSRRTVLSVLGAVAVAGCGGSSRSGPPTSAARRSETLRYGDDPSQFAELTWPVDGAGGRPVGVGVVIHGGFWRAQYDLALGAPLAASLTASGWAALNVEYRRVGNGGGYPVTLDDIGAAIDALAPIEGIDRSRVVTIGHSAGGHLAAQAATRDDPTVAVTAVVSQAGVLDLQRAAATAAGDDARLVAVDGDHFVVIDPATDAWAAVLDFLGER